MASANGKMLSMTGRMAWAAMARFIVMNCARLPSAMRRKSGLRVVALRASARRRSRREGLPVRLRFRCTQATPDTLRFERLRRA